MIRQNFECPTCSRVELDVICTSGSHVKRCTCGSSMEILWTKPRTTHIGIHPKDRAVVWYNPKTGRHATPGRNDVPMPDRYAREGFERREFSTLRELDAFCKQNKLVNEAAHYNRGSGRAYDEE